MQSKEERARGFTLLELMAVVALIGILLAIALPAFNAIGGSSRLEAAANEVHAAANLARQYALSRNQPTYLLFNEGQENPDLAYRAYALFTINTHTNPVDQAAGEFIAGWQLLPEGVVFDPYAGGSDNLFSVSEGAAWNGAIGKNNQLSIQGIDYIVHGYKPTGEAGSTTHWIFLAEGFFDGTRLQHTSVQGRQIRFGITGQSRILDIRYGSDGEPEVSTE